MFIKYRSWKIILELTLSQKKIRFTKRYLEVIPYVGIVKLSWSVFGVEVLGISTDSHFSHLAWVNQSRKQGGLGGLTYPLVSDFNKTISRDYGVLIEEAGIALR